MEVAGNVGDCLRQLTLLSLTQASVWNFLFGAESIKGFFLFLPRVLGKFVVEFSKGKSSFFISSVLLTEIKFVKLIKWYYCKKKIKKKKIDV